MYTLTANDAKRNFGELILNAQREPVKISKNNKDAVVVMSVRDYEELEAIKAEYLRHCFKSAKQDLVQGNAVDGEDFLNALQSIMQKNKFKLSKLAQANLLKIKTYTINNFSDIQWRNYKDTLLTGFQMLADNPDVGRNCDEVFPNGFYFPVGKHTAYFTKEDGFILIVAVLSQSQLPQNHL